MFTKVTAIYEILSQRKEHGSETTIHNNKANSTATGKLIETSVCPGHRTTLSALTVDDYSLHLSLEVRI